jgi:hypothetical protein
MPNLHDSFDPKKRPEPPIEVRFFTVNEGETPDAGPSDYDGCNVGCRIKGKHTLQWGLCEHAVRPEPAVSMTKIVRVADGYNTVGHDTYTVAQLAELIEPAFREVGIRLGPNALAQLQRGEQVTLSGGEINTLALAAAHAIVHRNDTTQEA